MTVELMRLKRSDFACFVDDVDEPDADFDKYLDKIAGDGEWSDDRELRAMSMLYDLPIEIYDSDLGLRRTFYEDDNRVSRTPSDGEATRRFRIVWDNDPGHYSSVFKLFDGFPISASPPGHLEMEGLQRQLFSGSVTFATALSEEQITAICRGIHNNVVDQIRAEEPAASKPAPSDNASASVQDSVSSNSEPSSTVPASASSPSLLDEASSVAKQSQFSFCCAPTLADRDKRLSPPHRLGNAANPSLRTVQQSILVRSRSLSNSCQSTTATTALSKVLTPSLACSTDSSRMSGMNTQYQKPASSTPEYYCNSSDSVLRCLRRESTGQIPVVASDPPTHCLPANRLTVRSMTTQHSCLPSVFPSMFQPQAVLRAVPTSPISSSGTISGIPAAGVPSLSTRLPPHIQPVCYRSTDHKLASECHPSPTRRNQSSWKWNVSPPQHMSRPDGLVQNCYIPSRPPPVVPKVTPVLPFIPSRLATALSTTGDYIPGLSSPCLSPVPSNYAAAVTLNGNRCAVTPTTTSSATSYQGDLTNRTASLTIDDSSPSPFSCVITPRYSMSPSNVSSPYRLNVPVSPTICSSPSVSMNPHLSCRPPPTCYSHPGDQLSAPTPPVMLRKTPRVPQYRPQCYIQIPHGVAPYVTGAGSQLTVPPTRRSPWK
eukprot:GHVQ01023473.1.p1 GENE.GHVQ01023473.1~~GHVQ01023473.1.p1  ORF type:complete len:656 (+),score=54.00 GHVQ01023473.1:1222-3189(+)